MTELKKSGLIFLFSVYSGFAFSQNSRQDASRIVDSLLWQSRNVLKIDIAKSFQLIDDAISIANSFQVAELADAYKAKTDLLIAIDSIPAALHNYKVLMGIYRSDTLTQLGTILHFGEALYEHGQFHEAEKILSEGIQIAGRRNEKEIEVLLIFAYAKVNINRGNLHLAMSDILTCLEIFERINDKKGIADCWHHIGIIHWKEGKNPEAMEAYEKSLGIRSEIKDSLGIAASYSNIGVIHKLERRFDKAGSYYSRSLGIRKRYNDQKGISQVLFNIGSLNFEMGRTEEALAYYFRSLEIKEKTGDNYGKLSNYLNMGDAERKSGNFDEAEKYYLAGLQLSQQLGANDFSKSFYRELSVLSGKQEKYKEAYEYQLKYSALKDTLISEEKNKALAELQAHYDLSEKQRDIDRLEQEGKLDAEKAARDKSFRNSLILIIFLIIVFTAVIYNRSVRVQRANKLLREQKNEIALRNQEKETLLREIHHRVKNNLQLTSSLLNLQARQVKDEEASRSLKEARDRVKAISLIHQKLYIRDQFSEVDISEYIPELCKSIALSNGIDSGKIAFEFEIQKLMIPLDMAISLGLIINESVTNSVKHAFPVTGKGIVKLNTINNGNVFTLVVKDNGSGINDKEKLNEGFGWQLIWSLIKKLDAKLTLENKNGTVITMIIPVRK